MKPDSTFGNQPASFWADIRQISQSVGYTQKAVKAKAGQPATRRGAAIPDRAAIPAQIKVPLPEEIKTAYTRLGLKWTHMFDADTLDPSQYGRLILNYFVYRAELLNRAKDFLMDKFEAETEYMKLREGLGAVFPDALFPENKQGNEKKKIAYLTAMVNMLIYINIPKSISVNLNPLALTLVTDSNGQPVYTMARRVDGAFPGVVNPLAIWEIKEYYYTTSFGSRIADGVYETMLDGLEIQEMNNAGHRRIHHYLIVDARETWWDKGRSYLCRMVDIMNMGQVDEVLLGREILERVPELVKSWLAELPKSGTKTQQGDIQMTDEQL